MRSLHRSPTALQRVSDLQREKAVCNERNTLCLVNLKREGVDWFCINGAFGLCHAGATCNAGVPTATLGSSLLLFCLDKNTAFA